MSIIGHSMGGLISVYAAIAEPNIFKSIVLTGPVIKLDPNVATPIKKMLSRVLAMLSFFDSGLLALLLASTRSKDDEDEDEDEDEEDGQGAFNFSDYGTSSSTYNSSTCNSSQIPSQLASAYRGFRPESEEELSALIGKREHGDVNKDVEYLVRFQGCLPHS